MTRAYFRVFLAVGLAMGSFCQAQQEITIDEDFATAPGDWVEVNSRTAPSNFGFSNTNNIGTAGEAGGQVVRRSTFTYYALPLASVLDSLDEEVVFEFDYRITTGITGANVAVGFFNPASVANGSDLDANGNMFIANIDDGVNLHVAMQPPGVGRVYASGGENTFGDNVVHRIKLHYVPTGQVPGASLPADAFGQVAGFVDGSVLRQTNLTEAQKTADWNMTHFGISATMNSDTTDPISIFVDNLSITYHGIGGGDDDDDDSGPQPYIGSLIEHFSRALNNSQTITQANVELTGPQRDVETIRSAEYGPVMSAVGWGGFYNGTADGAVRMVNDEPDPGSSNWLEDGGYKGGMRFNDRAGSIGSYVYTPLLTQTIDLSVAEARIEFDAQVQNAGITGVFRIMLKTTADGWVISNQVSALMHQRPTWAPLGGPPNFVIDPADLTWAAISNAAAAPVPDLNGTDGPRGLYDDAGPLTIGGAATPNLAEVSGFGIYVDYEVLTSNDLVVDAIRLTGLLQPVTELIEHFSRPNRQYIESTDDNLEVITHSEQPPTFSALGYGGFFNGLGPEGRVGFIEDENEPSANWLPDNGVVGLMRFSDFPDAAGSYFYTPLLRAPIDLSGAGSMIQFDASGRTSAGSLVGTARIILKTEANGWIISNQITRTMNDRDSATPWVPLGGTPIFSLDIGSLNWFAVTNSQVEPPDLDGLLDIDGTDGGSAAGGLANDAGPLTIGSAVSPDLGIVTGFGIMADYNIRTTNDMQIDAIKLTAGTAAGPNATRSWTVYQD